MHLFCIVWKWIWSPVASTSQYDYRQLWYTLTSVCVDLANIAVEGVSQTETTTEDRAKKKRNVTKRKSIWSTDKDASRNYVNKQKNMNE